MPSTKLKAPAKRTDSVIDREIRQLLLCTPSIKIIEAKEHLQQLKNMKKGEKYEMKEMLEKEFKRIRDRYYQKTPRYETNRFRARRSLGAHWRLPPICYRGRLQEVVQPSRVVRTHPTVRLCQGAANRRDGPTASQIQGIACHWVREILPDPRNRFFHDGGRRHGPLHGSQQATLRREGAEIAAVQYPL